MAIFDFISKVRFEFLTNDKEAISNIWKVAKGPHLIGNFKEIALNAAFPKFDVNPNMSYA